MAYRPPQRHSRRAERVPPHCCSGLDEHADAALGLAVRPQTSCGDDGASDQPRVTELVVAAVHAGKSAEQAGLEQGDVILGVDGKAVTSLEELQIALQAALNRPAFLLVARDDAFLVLAFPAL